MAILNERNDVSERSVSYLPDPVSSSHLAAALTRSDLAPLVGSRHRAIGRTTPGTRTDRDRKYSKTGAHDTGQGEQEDRQDRTGLTDRTATG